MIRLIGGESEHYGSSYKEGFSIDNSNIRILDKIMDNEPRRETDCFPAKRRNDIRDLTSP